MNFFASVSSLVKTWKVDSGVNRLVERLSALNNFEGRVASVLARLEGREKAVQIGKDKIMEELEVVHRRNSENFTVRENVNVMVNFVTYLYRFADFLRETLTEACCSSQLSFNRFSR